MDRGDSTERYERPGQQVAIFESGSLLRAGDKILFFSIVTYE